MYHKLNVLGDYDKVCRGIMLGALRKNETHVEFLTVVANKI